MNQLAADLQDPGQPEEINRLGRTITAWRTQISNWHAARVTNAPTEAANNLIKRVKRAAFGFTNFDNFCSMPANPTGRSSKPSLRPKTRRAPYVIPLELRLPIPDDLVNISSTAARAGNTGWMTAAAAKFDTDTGAWTDPARYQRRQVSGT